MKNRRALRLRKLLELIATQKLHTQEEVCAALTAEGWQVTQSSVSRDIAALKLSKEGGIYVRRSPERERDASHSPLSILGESILDSAPAGDALVVIHTPPGEASRVGATLDRLAYPEVVGTIAGDDTVFVAVRDAAAQKRFLSTLRKQLGDEATAAD
jgi:transcriptional regulator of arginine metabolism